MPDPALRLVPDLQQLAGDIARAHVALQDIDRAIDGAEKKATVLRDEQAKRRIAIGRLLIEARQSVKHGGWLPYLEKIGIEQQRASDWMRLAGHVEGKPPTSERDGDLADHAPTLADAGIDPRRRGHRPSPTRASTSAPASAISRSLKPSPRQTTIRRRGSTTSTPRSSTSTARS